MVSHGGGSHNLAAVQLAFIELQGLQFTAEQIVSIAGHNGGSKNIAAVQSAFSELQGLDFSADQIVRMVSHDGGSKNIEAVQSAFEALQGYGFTPKSIVQLAGRAGGSGAIKSSLASPGETGVGCDVSDEADSDLGVYLSKLFPADPRPSEAEIDKLIKDLQLSVVEGHGDFLLSDSDETSAAEAGDSPEGLSDPFLGAAVLPIAGKGIPKRKRDDKAVMLGASDNTFFSASAAEDSGVEEEGAKRPNTSAWAIV